MERLTPPNDVPFGVMEDGLKYWEVDHRVRPGLNQTILTEDPDIRLERYVLGDPRQGGPSYLLHLNATKIGVVLHEDPLGLHVKREGPIGHEPAARRVGDRRYFEITAIGAPVYYYDHATNQGHLTDVTWAEFRQGKRDKFRNAAEQALALKVLPPLLAAASGSLRPPRPKMTKSKRFFELSSELKVEINRGDLIRKA